LVLDLTGVGQNLSPDQWYQGLLNLVARQLQREDELEEFWEAHRQLGPLQRFMAALEGVVLRALAPNPAPASRGPASPHPGGGEPRPLPPGLGGRGGGRLVIFIDEIDAVRSLPFSTDEFFAAIRQCYNRRTREPEFERLTFCLLGVASPSDLIRDVRMTPFN